MVFGNDRASTEDLILHHAVAAVPVYVNQLVQHYIVDLTGRALSGVDPLRLLVCVHSLSHIFIVGIRVNIVREFS